jgi:hypothetical protein
MRMRPAVREFSIKLPLVLLMIVGALMFAGGIHGYDYGRIRLDSSSRGALVLIGLALLFGPWAVMRCIFRGRS